MMTTSLQDSLIAGQELRVRLLEARRQREEGEPVTDMPSDEEIRDMIKLIRAGKFTAKTKAKAPTLKDMSLEDLLKVEL